MYILNRKIDSLNINVYIMSDWLETLTGKQRVNGKFPKPYSPELKWAKESFSSALKYGLITVGWYGAIFAARRVFKYTPHPIMERTFSPRVPGAPIQRTDPSFPELVGIFPAFASFLDIISGAYFYIPYRIDLALYNYDRKRLNTQKL